MPNIGVLVAKIVADPTGYTTGTNIVIAQTNKLLNTVGPQLNKFGNLATSAISSLTGGGILGQAASAIATFAGSSLASFSAMGAMLASAGPGAIIAAIAAATIGAAIAFVGFGQAGIREIGTQARLARQIGVTTSAYISLSGALSASGVELESQGQVLQQFLRRTGQLRQHLGGGGANAGGAGMALTGSNAAEHDQMAQGLRQLGINARAFVNAVPEQQLRMIAQGMEGVANASDRSAISYQILGRHGQALGPLLQRGVAEFDRLNSLGQVRRALISDADIANMEAASKAMRRASQYATALWDSLKFRAGAYIAPIVEEFNRLLESGLKPLQPILNVLGTVLIAWLAPLTWMLPIILQGINALVPALDFVVDAFSWLGKAAGYTIDFIQAKFNEFGGGSFVSTLSSIWTWLKSSAATVWEGIKVVASAAWNAIYFIADFVLGAIFRAISTTIRVGMAIFNGLLPLFQAIGSAGSAVWDAIATSVGALWRVVSSVWSVISVTVMAVLEDIAKAFGITGDTGINWLGGLTLAIQALTVPLIMAANVITWVADKITEATSQLDRFANRMREIRAASGGFWSGLTGGPSVIGGISNWVPRPQPVTTVPAGPIAPTEVGTRGFARDSVDAVTAIIQHEFGQGGAQDPQTQAIATLTEVQRQALDVLRDLLARPVGQQIVATFGGQ